jgi:hypothetical protein
LLLTGLFTSLLASNSPVPGTLNYLEGQVSIDGSQLNPKSAGSAEVDQNGTLSTDRGRAEILLTPGVFLRLGDNSSVRMVSPALTDTQVELQHGEAMLEVNQLFKENSIRVLENGSSTRILKNGLYQFNADRQSMAVYDGQAEVSRDDEHVKLKKGKEAFLNAPLRAVKFDRQPEDALYAWSKLRSQYNSEASAQYASVIYVNNAPWWGPGWYWNPYWGTYGFIPGGVLYSPFGWGFYSPWAVGPYFGWYHTGRFYRGVPTRAGVLAYQNRFNRLRAPGTAATRPRMGGGLAPAPRMGEFAGGPHIGGRMSVGRAR